MDEIPRLGAEVLCVCVYNAAAAVLDLFGDESFVLYSCERLIENLDRGRQ